VTPFQEESDVDGAFAHDDGLGVAIKPAVYIDAKIAGAKAGERAHHRAGKFVLRRARADRFSDRKRE